MQRWEGLIEQAESARKKAYAPYSGFCVGAALLAASGRIYTGCNVENAAFSPSVCAERTAFVKAVSEGERDFEAIAIVGGNCTETPDSVCPPCGVCRQVMAEFCDPESFVVCLKDGADIKTCLLKELLPMSFGGKESFGRNE